ncbi:MAG: hypothetical protein WD066_02605, partial [Planctomycetaceae bacterium]
MALEVEPRLSNAVRFAGTSDKAWSLFGGPQDAASIVAFLQGQQSPTVEFFGFDSTPNVLAATWRVFFDSGCALGDYRAAYKAKGERVRDLHRNLALRPRRQADLPLGGPDGVEPSGSRSDKRA